MISDILRPANKASDQRNDHFDGKRFHNVFEKRDHLFKDIFKVLTTSNRKKWPKIEANSHWPRLHLVLNQGQAAVTFVNHATLLIQLPGLNILTDPVWSKRVSPLRFAGPKRARQPGIAFDELPKINPVLISHNHYDHLDLATVKKLAERDHPRILISKGDLDILERHQIDNAREMDWWEKENFASLEINFAPTQHFSSRGLLDRNRSLWGSFMIRHQGKNLYFGGDSAYSAHYRQIRERLGPTDLAFLPIGAYEPYWFMGLVHMKPEESVQAHLDLQSKQSVAIHFGTFQLTEEGIDEPVARLNQRLNEVGLSADRFTTLGEGETQVFDL